MGNKNNPNKKEKKTKFHNNLNNLGRKTSISPSKKSLSDSESINKEESLEIDNYNILNKIGMNAKFLNSPYTLGKKGSSYPSNKLLSDLENVKQVGNFNNIKSKYILSKIFKHLTKKKAFKIMNYNKAIQNRLDGDVKYYKKFSETFSTIEIEIIPKADIYGTFDFLKTESKNIHVYIYFNNKIQKVNKNKLFLYHKINKVKVIIDYQVKSFNKLFESCDIIESITFTKFYRNNINDMSFMFYGCSSLKNINFSSFKTDNVTDMSYMFCECKSLNKLDLSNFNTDKVTNMQYMFSDCSSLKELKLDNFNTKNVENMEGMFCNCISIEFIPVNNFNTINVSNMTKMFNSCSSLKDIDLSNFSNTYENTLMKSMFAFCSDELKDKIQTLYENIDYEAFDEYNEIKEEKEEKDITANSFFIYYNLDKDY